MKRLLRVFVFVLISVLFGVIAQADNFVLYDNEHLSVTTNYDNGVLWDCSTADMLEGGSINNAYVNDEATFSVLEYAFISEIYAYNNSITKILDGSTGALDAYDDSNVSVFDGTINRLRTYNNNNANIFGGNISYLTTYGNSDVNITNGDITNCGVNDDSIVNMSNGNINSFDLNWNFYGNVNVSGGNISYLFARNGTINLHGYNFRPTGGLNVANNKVIGTGILTGKWFNGTAWIIQIEMNESSAVIQLSSDPVGPRCGDINHPYPPMDFNRDCIVDFYDFALFMSHWLDCTTPDCI